MSGAYIISEEILYKLIPIDPIEAVAIQGVAGVGYTTVIVFIATFVFGVESPGLAIRQIAENRALCALVLGHTVAVAVSGYFGNCLTKLVSGMARTTTNTIRTVVVWAVCLVLGWESFIFMQLVGYSIAAYGVLLYNGFFDQLMNKKEVTEEKLDGKSIPLKEVAVEEKNSNQ